MSREREVKLAAPPAFRLPDLAGALDGFDAVETEPRRFQTVYVDTADLRVARWGCSLRHREGQGWTVKLPTNANGRALVRGEYLIAGDARRVPGEAADLLRAYVRGAELRPVVRLRTLRRRLELRDAAGRPVGEIVDDEVSVMEGARVAGRFRELEVEVDDGVPDEVLGTLVAELRARGAGSVDNTPKYLRALGSLADRPPEVVVPTIGPGAPVVDVVRAAIAASTTRLMRHDAGVRSGDDPEDVHQARVATRRLRSDLCSFRELLEPEWVVGLRAELGWLGAELGAVRDTDVLMDRLRGRARELPARDAATAERLLGRLAARRDEARTTLLTAMRSSRYLEVLDRLVAAAAEPVLRSEAVAEPVLPSEAADRSTDEAGTGSIPVLASVMQRPWAHLRNAVDALGPDATDAELHEARIRAKRVRYAAEAVAPVFGKRARAFARAAVGLQDVLGEHQDSVVASAWLRGVAASGARAAFVAGELASTERRAAAEARAAWPDAWKSLARRRLRFWT